MTILLLLCLVAPLFAIKSGSLSRLNNDLVSSGFYRYGLSYYKVANEKGNWDSGHVICNEMAKRHSLTSGIELRGQMAEIRNPADLRFLKKVVRRSGENVAFLGGKAASKESLEETVVTRKQFQSAAAFGGDKFLEGGISAYNPFFWVSDMTPVHSALFTAAPMKVQQPFGFGLKGAFGGLQQKESFETLESPELLKRELFESRETLQKLYSESPEETLEITAAEPWSFTQRQMAQKAEKQCVVLPRTFAVGLSHTNCERVAISPVCRLMPIHRVSKYSSIITSPRIWNLRTEANV